MNLEVSKKLCGIINAECYANAVYITTDDLIRLAKRCEPLTIENLTQEFIFEYEIYGGKK